MRKFFLAIPILAAIALTCWVMIWLYKFNYRECLQVGHSEFYCRIQFFK